MPDRNTPLISFVITFYNLPAEWLRECLDSILALSLSRSEREVIVVDDGSATSPAPTLADYADDIIYIRQPNKGLSEARNTGLDIASGSYVQFVDGDDRLVTKAYEQCLDIVRFNAPDVVMFDRVSHEGAVPAVARPRLTDGTALLAGANLKAAAWGYVFRRSLLGGLRFTPGLLHEDEEFTPLLLLNASRIFQTDSKAYFYRLRDSSIMSRKDRKHILKRLNDLERIILRLSSVAATLPAEKAGALGRRVAQLTMDYLYNTITLTSSRSQLAARTARLRAAGLYPLPRRNYSLKYVAFSRLANSKTGLALLNGILKNKTRK